ncbi:MAG: hypothetical protein K5905_06060 [Roseibium sp.]|uniref:hypothetical protein n=1 Tax=Roseibium sp. TaxID=1936156 RepID=UPI002635A3DE|nr:hypothetical protein [Roseibium sp.]MCV0425014.1 hypothetical protein [Roseibium sp.]
MGHLTLTRLLIGKPGRRVILGLVEYELESQRRYIRRSVAAIIDPFDHVGLIRSRRFGNNQLFSAYFDFLDKRIEKFMTADEVLNVVGIPDRHQDLLTPLFENYKKAQGVLTTCTNFWLKDITLDIAPLDCDGDPMDYELDEIDDDTFHSWLDREETMRAKQSVEDAHAEFDKAAAEFAATIRNLS